jgi:hypothetical protein
LKAVSSGHGKEAIGKQFRKGIIIEVQFPVFYTGRNGQKLK